METNSKEVIGYSTSQHSLSCTPYINIILQGTPLKLKTVTKSMLESKAYELWEADSKPLGREFEYWIKAEKYFKPFLVLSERSYAYLRKVASLPEYNPSGNPEEQTICDRCLEERISKTFIVNNLFRTKYPYIEFLVEINNAALRGITETLLRNYARMLLELENNPEGKVEWYLKKAKERFKPYLIVAERDFVFLDKILSDFEG